MFKWMDNIVVKFATTLLLIIFTVYLFARQKTVDLSTNTYEGTNTEHELPKQKKTDHLVMDSV